MKETHAVQFGVCLPNFPFGVQPSTDAIVAVAQAAERLQYDSVWVSDHVLVPEDRSRYGQLYEVLTTLAYVAARTERIRLGVSVLVLPQRHAVLVAKQIATLDNLSGGRVILGVGAGWMQGEFDNLGADFHRRGRHTDEALRVLKTLWQEEQPQFAGEFYRFRHVLFGPRPVQPGGPPIWIGGNSEPALRRAVTLADGWHADDVPLEQLRAVSQQLQARAQAHGRTVTISLRRTVDLRPAAAAMGRLATPGGGGGIQGGQWPGSSTGVLTGTLEEINATLRQVAVLGVSHFVCQFEHATQAEHLAQIAVFAQECMPHAG
jgi:probable F420-dependent oxidoreductase